MLDGLYALAGSTCSYAARPLRAQVRGPARPREQRRGRRPVYGPELLAPLAKAWATLGGICGKRLATVTARTMDTLKRHGELEPTALGARQDLTLSALSRANLMTSQILPMSSVDTAVPVGRSST